MGSEVEYLRFIFKGRLDDANKRKVSSAVWKKLYTLTERGISLNDYVLIKKRMQDFFITFSDLIKIGEDEYVLYFMTPSPTARLDIIRALKNGINVGHRKLKTIDVDILNYGVEKNDYYITLSPIIVTRNGDYYLPPEIDFYKNLLGYLEIKHKNFTGERINFTKNNFNMRVIWSTPVKIDFQTTKIFGSNMGFKLRITDDVLEQVSTVVQLGFGTKSGMGYGFIMPRRVVRSEDIFFIVRHPKFWSTMKDEEVETMNG